MSRERRLLASLAVLLLITAVGTVGYRLIEGASFADALYMTIITISTVGFAEVFPLSTGGRVLTSGLIVIGVGAVFYTAVQAIEMTLERFLGGEQRRRRMTREIDNLVGHVIVCGFGRVGQNAWRALHAEKVPAVVVESDDLAATTAAEQGALVVVGDATRNEVLEEAGIERARALIACVRSDSDNLVVVLSAKHRRSDLPVIARATELQAQEKLRIAGADHVVSPQLVGAHRLAALATEPRLDEFVDVVLHGRLMELRIEGVEVAPRSPLAGRTIRDSEIRERSGALLLAIEDPGGDLPFNPEPETMLRPGQMVVAIGNEAQVEALRKYALGE